jgi:hypothetical protein
MSVGVPAAAVSVHRFAPEDFLLVFSSAMHRNKVAALPSVTHAGFSLFFKPWNRQAQVTHVSLGTRVQLVIEGVPPHAWEPEVIEDLLGKSCAVEEVAPETRSRQDLSSFKLSAWTSDLDSIPVARTLLVPEPPSRGPPAAPATQLPALQYKVLVHVTSVEEDEASLVLGDRVLTPSQGHRGGHGRPDAGAWGHGGGGGARRRSRSTVWQKGVPDRRGGHGGGGQQRAGQMGMGSLHAEPQDWVLPPMVDPTPLVALDQGGMGLEACEAVSLDQGAKRLEASEIVAAPDKGDAETVAFGTPLAEKASQQDIRSGGPSQKAVLEEDPEARIEPSKTQLEPLAQWEDAHESLPLLGDTEGVEQRQCLIGADVRDLKLLLDTRLGAERSDLSLMLLHEEDWSGDQALLDLSPRASVSSSCSGSTHLGPTEEVGADAGRAGGGALRDGCHAMGYVQISLSGSKDAASEEDGQEADRPEPEQQEEEDRHEVVSFELESADKEKGMSPQETVAFGRIKEFCSSLLKKLAPPLLQEIERAS